MQNEPTMNSSTNAAKLQAGQYPTPLESSVTPEAQLKERDTFLHAVLGDHLPIGLFAHVWRPSPTHTDWVTKPADVERSGHRGWNDVYLSVGLRGERGTPLERVTAAQVAGLVGFVADVDVLDPAAHKQQALPASQREALDFLDSLDAKPTLIINSGHGVQAWWLFTEQWRFAEGDNARAQRGAAGWQAYINARAAQHGWKLDSVGDLPRLLRVPGTFNAKQRKHIVPVRLLHHDDTARYDPAALMALCDDTAIPNRTRDDSDKIKRFTKSNPCPVCGGYEELEQGIGERCWGFLGRDDDVAFCTREEYAGDIEPITTALGSVVYRHYLSGQCDCGQTHANIGQGDGPVPGRALWNATYFRDRYRDRLRYVAQFGKWYDNNGKWWDPDSVNAAMRLGYEAVDAMYQRSADEPDRKRKREYADLAIKLDSAKNIADMIRGASAMKPIAARHDTFDADDWKVVAANGLIDLRTGELLPHDPNAMFSMHLGPTADSIVYDPTAQCPNWLSFLRMVFPEQDGEEMIGYLRRLAGYCLTGKIYEEAVFFLTGEGQNGKSTYTQALIEVLGTFFHQLYIETLLSTTQDRIPTDIAGLVGKRLAVAGENDEDRTLAEGFIKACTDPLIRARFMRQDFFNFRPQFHLILHTNHVPRIRGRDKGIWRRIRVIPFNYTIPESERVKGWFEANLRPELPGILAWMVQGCLEWQRIGLAEPARVLKAAGDYKADSDLLGQFVADYVFEESGGFLASSTIHEAYSKWCRRQNEQPRSVKALVEAIKHAYHVDPIYKKGTGRGFPGLDTLPSGYGW